jgi:hypothetical protein
MSGSTTLGYTGGIVTFTAPITGLYLIDAIGAGGGYVQPSDSLPYYGGSGAHVSGLFQPSAGETLNVLVGGAGQGPPGNHGDNPGSAGGGGGTFITGPGEPLLIAGGGGR